jgi:hypothetical protein
LFCRSRRSSISSSSVIVASRPKIGARRRRPLLDGAQCEPAAATLGVETPASLDVAVNELRVLARRAKDATRVGGAEKDGLLGRGRLHLTSNVGHLGDQNIGRTSTLASVGLAQTS